MMLLSPKLFLTTVVGLLIAATTYLPQRALAGCSHLPSVSVSPPDGDVTSFDDADQVGGLHMIDKITQIEVYSVDALFRNVISKVVITYLRTDGEKVILSHGNGGDLAGQVTFDEGQYLSAIEMFVDQYVQHVNICRTDGICFGPFGFNEDTAPNRILFKQRSVIKALLGQSGNVVDKIRVYYETDKMYKAEIGEVIYQNITVPTIISDLSFQSPKAKVTVDNLGSSVEQSSTVVFEETVSTYETTIVTKTKQLFGAVSLATGPGFLVQLGVADLSATFTVGASFSTSLSESNTKEMKSTITREYTVVAPPFAVVTGQVYWRQIKYAYNWNAPVQCHFTFEPQTAFRGGMIEGNMFGTQAFPHSYVKFTQAFTTTPPMTAPTIAPMMNSTQMPVDVPIEERTVSPVLTPPTSFPARPPRPVASPLKIPQIGVTMSPFSAPPVTPPLEVLVPVNVSPLSTANPTMKSSTGWNPLSPLPNPPASVPLDVIAPGNGFPTSSPTNALIKSPVVGPPISPSPKSLVSPQFPTTSKTTTSPSQLKAMSGSPMLSLPKSPTSSPTKFTDPSDDYVNNPTSMPDDEPSNNPTTQKDTSTGRPTRKPRSNLYDDENNEEIVTSDSLFFSVIVSFWTMGILQLFVMM